MKWQRARINAEIQTLENERKRIASDLHDDIGPLLSTIKLHINQLEPKSDFETTVLEKSTGYLDDAVAQMRNIANNLLPNILVRKGLTSAIEDYIEKTKSSALLKIEFDYNSIIELRKEMEINIYRIIQEIVHNTIKHANAANLVIKFRKEGNFIKIVTRDDGVGFNFKNQLKTGQGLGLMNFQSRIDALNARFNVISSPQSGTTYIIEVPVD